MILLEIDLVYKDSQGKLQRTVYPVGLPTKSIAEAQKVAEKGVAISMKKQKAKIISMKTRLYNRKEFIESAL